MMMMRGREEGSNTNPFTASQWHELERQALIFKYMAAGMPVPSDLILPLRLSLCTDSALIHYIPYSPTLRWGPLSYQLGDGKRNDDPEPGRCRRTDGKKWRCSKEANPESKYCERHMHRGKSRSRKHVELSLNSTNNNANTNAANLTPLAIKTHHQSQYLNNANYRNFFGAREEVNEYPFFTRADGSTQPSRDDSHQLRIGLSSKDEKTVKLEDAKNVRPFHCFFDDCSAQTKLSIAMPVSSHDMVTKAQAQFYHDNR